MANTPALSQVTITTYATLYATNDEIDAAGMYWVENVFWRGVKAWARIILPNLRLNADADLNTALSIKSVVTAIGGITECRVLRETGFQRI